LYEHYKLICLYYKSYVITIAEYHTFSV